MSARPDVVVAGAGIIGTMIAWHLARAGARVTLADPAPAAASAPTATWASAGGLRRQGRSAADQPLTLRAGARWPGLAEELGADLEAGFGGHLHIAERESELPALRARLAADRAAGIDIRWLEGADLRAVAPELTPRAVAGVWTPGDGQAHPGRVARAALDAFRGLGGAVRLGAPVALARSGDGVAGVMVGGAPLDAGLVIVAAGAWSAGLVAPLGLALPLRWRALTMLVSDPAPRDILGPTVTGVGRNLSLKQLRSGQFMLGGRWYAEPTGAGLAARPVDAHVAAQWSEGVAVLPRLAGLKLNQSWAGAEAQSPDGDPLIGRTRIPGLYLACGFSNHGFQISPAVGEAVAEDVAGGGPKLLAPFDPHRLDGGDPAALARFRAEPILAVA
ncbi:MAG: hypothetical protein DI556_17205 [Rhodovulum sulfidophilum]|uniref:FAD dependent oxidoreductase domain-containing protein n=1 Tax=Rhodovulum sulfidophilum TaxID=35806 RepID=A0A2W5N291_RHOSU|nr:MAG: hypothetical protein DI556_17205 [Rhodovulum sulfidophilum]